MLPQCTHGQRRFLAIGFLDIDPARLAVHEPIVAAKPLSICPVWKSE
jgi:hypothetical protein